ncbi:S1C family serine protease [Nocardia sp. NBC_01388]
MSAQRPDDPQQWPRYGQPLPPQPPRSPHRGRTAVLALAAAAAVGVGAVGLGTMGFGLGAQHAQPAAGKAGWPAPLVQPVGNSKTAATQPNAAAMDTAVQGVIPGLVNVNSELGMQGAETAGTGIVLTSDGEILTNNHVVTGATDISVTDLGNGQTYPATVVGYDRSQDVAVLKLSGASGLQTAPIGNSDSATVGEQIAGVGNAGGTGQPSVAAGRVTALGQTITASDESSGSSEQLQGLIQIAANIQPGDSGGPLIDSSGQVIGMDTAASTNYRFRMQRGGAQSGGGQGFAIPINQALSIAHDIDSGNRSATVHIGATPFLGVSVSTSDGVGAVVQQVVSGGPAAQLGLAAGDVITAADGNRIDSATALTNSMDSYKPGDRVTFKWTDPQSGAQQGQVALGTGPVG